MSTPRHCEFWKASNGKWYLDLAVNEYSYDDEDDEDSWRRGSDIDGTYEDSITYGPFDTERACESYLDNFSNPGSFYTDSSGTKPPPVKSPNGSPVVNPRRGSSLRYETQRSVSVPQPKAPVTPPTAKADPASKPYKVYGKKTIKPPFQNYQTGVEVPVHTRMKGKAFGPLTKTRFKKNDQVSIIVPKNASTAKDGKTPKQVVVNDPEFKGANQTWTLDSNDVKESVLKTFIVETLKHVR